MFPFRPRIFSIAICIMLMCAAGSFASAEIIPNGLPDVYPVTASDSGILSAPEECFTMYGKENKLEGTPCYVVGMVTEHMDIPSEDAVMPAFVLQTENGYVLLIDLYTYTVTSTSDAEVSGFVEPDSDYSLPEIGTFVKVVCLYSGYSDNYNMPTFYYGMPNALVAKFKQDAVLNDATPVPQPETTLAQQPTAGQQNALRKAYDYLNFTAFSYSGLIKQLEYEGFKNDECVYAVDNCGADWKEQAAKKAKQYLDFMGFSRDKLVAQLEHDGFTYEQAVYGAEQNGL